MASFTPKVWQQRCKLTLQNVIDYLDSQFETCDVNYVVPTITLQKSPAGEGLKSAVYEWLNSIELRAPVVEHYKSLGWREVLFYRRGTGKICITLYYFDRGTLE